MKVGRYAVSVQWGQGMHYFLHHSDDKHLAWAVAEEERKRLAARRKKVGAKPQVFVWEQI